ncbi:Predicted kinase, aminoglycoside phosphotransferase (APT) family [Nocardioides scoriae]|uniref:Predicted kinase, aminoglycoside phosphotransferase (APT) family n=1 Tax=Nocardioides scoriae TaxID=642780 RepID=A0A1H1QGG8_9ACTN|nr:phosphotransferase [Nocardioides scoriae]SDS22560.1 Predicted kinase, aminoglycoside phosphotransferase (APT) family [Nocardioides scoriae]
MDAFATSLRPLAGGHSGETFLAGAGDEQLVVRVYAARSRARGPLAPEVDAAVLELVRGLLPVPTVLEVRRGDPDTDVPGLLVTSLEPGERLDLVLPGLDDAGLAATGHALGIVLARLGHVVQPRAGFFGDRSLVPVAPLPDLVTFLDAHLDALDRVLGAEAVAALEPVVGVAQDLLDADRRTVLVHADLGPGNVLVDPASGEVTAVVDWEFAHAGSPWSDLGTLLRDERRPAFVGAVLAAYASWVPDVPDDVLDRARSVDLAALVDLAVRDGASAPVLRARDRLLAVARTGDVHAC